jgi:hypothetical protein
MNLLVLTVVKIWLSSGLKMEAACTSEKLSSASRSTRHYNPEDIGKIYCSLFWFNVLN